VGELFPTRRFDRMTNRRKDSEWYTCSICGVDFPRAEVIVQRGSIRCLRNCKDMPGRDPLSDGYPLRTEELPPPLPEDPTEI
jgi:hypothetical protein